MRGYVQRPSAVDSAAPLLLRHRSGHRRREGTSEIDAGSRIACRSPYSIVSWGTKGRDVTPTGEMNLLCSSKTLPHVNPAIQGQGPLKINSAQIVKIDVGKEKTRARSLPSRVCSAPTASSARHSTAMHTQVHNVRRRLVAELKGTVGERECTKTKSHASF